MSRSKSSRQWLMAHKNDPFVKQSKLDGYRSRAVYKLKEVNEKVGLIKPGMTVLELGSAPGGWTQYVADILQTKGKLIAVDCLLMDAFPQVIFVQGDFTEEAVQALIKTHLNGQAVDVLLSDMAPNLSGVKTLDSLRTMALAEVTLQAVHEFLKPGGSLFMKLFHGAGFDELIREVKKTFKHVSIRKPLASRSQSRETYLLALGYRLSII
jgi:23S rRNA (uridine2552-2'-O)-methyltransferase